MDKGISGTQQIKTTATRHSIQTVIKNRITGAIIA